MEELMEDPMTAQPLAEERIQEICALAGMSQPQMLNCIRGKIKEIQKRSRTPVSESNACENACDYFAGELKTPTLREMELLYRTLSERFTS